MPWVRLQDLVAITITPAYTLAFRNHLKPPDRTRWVSSAPAAYQERAKASRRVMLPLSASCRAV